MESEEYTLTSNRRKYLLVGLVVMNFLFFIIESLSVVEWDGDQKEFGQIISGMVARGIYAANTLITVIILTVMVCITESNTIEINQGDYF